MLLLGVVWIFQNLVVEKPERKDEDEEKFAPNGSTSIVTAFFNDDLSPRIVGEGKELDTRALVVTRGIVAPNRFFP